MGVVTDRMDELVKGTLADPSCGGNPLKLNAENVKQLLEACI